MVVLICCVDLYGGVERTVRQGSENRRGSRLVGRAVVSLQDLKQSTPGQLLQRQVCMHCTSRALYCPNIL